MWELDGGFCIIGKPYSSKFVGLKVVNSKNVNSKIVNSKIVKFRSLSLSLKTMAV